MNATTTMIDTEFATTSTEQNVAVDLQSLSDTELALVGGGTDITNMY